AAVARELVAPAPGDEVELHAGALLRGVRAGRRHLDFLERVEIVVGRRRVARRDIADDRAVDVPLLVRAAAHRGERRLLARQVAADVGAAHDHSGRLLDDDPRVARVGDLLERLFRKARRERGRFRVDDRALAGDRHGLLYGRELELAVDFGVEAGLNDDVGAHQLLEAGEVEVHLIDANRDAREAKRPGVGAHGDDWLN